MRRAHGADGDRGVIAVIVAVVMIPVMFGMGAMVIDVGSLYAERRELQNAADAGAFAVAQDCATTTCSGAAAKAQSMANANSNDGTSAVDEVCGTGAGLSGCSSPPTSVPAGAAYVQVRTSTRTAGGGTVMPPLLARALIPGYTGRTIAASAVVAWGNPAGGRTLPLTMSECEFDRLVPSGVPTEVGSGTPQVMYHSGNASDSCSASRSGADAPGAFGFITPDNSSSCVATVVNGLLPTSTGNAVPNNSDCQAMLHRSTHTVANTAVLVPIYEDNCADGACVSGTGANVTYPIIGYAEFFITGWSFGGQYYYPDGAARPCSGSQTCIAGYFVRFVDLTAALGSGPAEFGVSAVKLVG